MESEAFQYRKAVIQSSNRRMAVFRIGLDANGGALDASYADAEGGRLSSLPIPTHDEGYRFVGWYTQREGGVEVTGETVFDEDATIYARWSRVYRQRELSIGGVTVFRSGIHENARLTVGRELARQKGESAIYDRFYTWKEQGDALAIYEVSLSERFTGEVTILFPVPDGYEGKTLTVAHGAKNGVDTFAVEVSGNTVRVTVTELSPFAILKQEGQSTGTTGGIGAAGATDKERGVGTAGGTGNVEVTGRIEETGNPNVMWVSGTVSQQEKNAKVTAQAAPAYGFSFLRWGLVHLQHLVFGKNTIHIQ